MTSLPPDGKPSSRPIFIGGMFKSGTTLLRAMLGQHSAIVSGLETYWFMMGLDGTDPDATEKTDFSRLSAFFGIEVVKLAELGQAASCPEEFLDMLMREKAAQAEKPRWAEKTPGNVAHLDRIWNYWADAQVIHIIRDPRDVFASLVEANKWNTPGAFFDRWSETVARCEELKETLRPTREQYLEVRYEDLVLEPGRIIAEVLKFLGEDWEEPVANFGGRDEDFELVKTVAGKESTTLRRLKQPLTSARVGIWRRVLSESDIAGLEAEARSRDLGSLYGQIISETPGY